MKRAWEEAVSHSPPDRAALGVLVREAARAGCLVDVFEMLEEISPALGLDVLFENLQWSLWAPVLIDVYGAHWVDLVEPFGSPGVCRVVAMWRAVARGNVKEFFEVTLLPLPPEGQTEAVLAALADVREYEKLRPNYDR